MNRSVPHIGRSLLLSVVLLIGTVSLSHAQVGILAGANFEQSGDIQDAATTLDRDQTTGYHVGLAFEFGGERFRVRPAAVFRQVGNYRLSENADAQEAVQEFDVSVIEVPVDLRLEILPVPVLNPYIMGGPMLSIPRGEGEFDDATESWSFSGNVGGGLSIDAGPITIQPEVRYEFGVTDYVSDSFTIGDRTIEPSDKPQFSAFSVRLHLLY